MLIRNILLAVGVVSLIAGVVLSLVWLNQVGNTGAERVEAARPAILVAAHAIGSGTLLRPEDTRWKEVGPKEVRPGTLVRGQFEQADFVGAVTRREFEDGEALIVSDVVRPNERQFLAAVLKPGMRAVAVSFDGPQSVGGLVLPGDEVDVILTQTVSDAQPNPALKAMGETVLRDVRVVAVDQTLNTTVRSAAARAPVSPEARPTKTITFEVTEKQAERLAVASQLGRLQLSLRPLEVATGAETVGAGPRSVTWATDVSPALSQFNRRKAPPAGSIERATRRPPEASERLEPSYMSNALPADPAPLGQIRAQTP